MTVVIPNKSSFKLDEVCELVGVKPYILRFWESEFDQIRPITSASGQKIYEHKDIVVILKIKDLLISRQLPVEKAKRELILGPERARTQRPNKTIAKTLPKRERPRRNAIHTAAPLEAGNLQKLVLAKAKLRSIISQTQSMQSLLNGAE